MSKIRNLFKKLRKQKSADESELDSVDYHDLPKADHIDEESSLTKKPQSFSEKLKAKLIKKSYSDKKSKSSDHFNERYSNLKKRFNKIEWEKIPQNFFSPLKKQSHHRLFQITATLLIVFTLGKFSGIFLNGSKNYKDLKTDSAQVSFERTFTQDDLNNIKNSGIFKTPEVERSKNQSTTPKSDENIICKSADRKSGQSITLINTIVLQDSSKSLASVKTAGKVDSFRQGDKLSNSIRLDQVQRLRLIVKDTQTGLCEYIESDDLKKERESNPIAVLSPAKSKAFKKNLAKIDGIENVGNKFKIKKDFLKNKMSDIGSLLTQARGIQINNPDGSISFKVVDIEPGGIFAYLGMQDGDIITNINGEPIKNLNEVMNLFGKVSDLSNLNLTLKRSGEEVTQDYSIQ